MTLRTAVSSFVLAGLFFTSANLGLAQAPNAAAIVSAASFQEPVSPDSIATIFGTDLAPGHFSAEVDESGNLPTVLGGISVEIDGTLARLIFASPTQINLVVPEGVTLGIAAIRIVNGGQKGAAEADPDLMANVELTAPGIFAVRCLRADQGAVLNGVTFRLGPFRLSTPENPGDDKRTRLALFATGIRYAGNPERKEATNVAGSVTLEGVDVTGRVFPIELEYAGPAPNFFGLDQLNGVLSPELEGIGLLQLRLRVDGQVSNTVSVYISPDGLGDLSLTPEYEIDTVAGNGEPGHTGDGEAAVAARLQTPSAVAVDRFLNLFIADSENGVVRRIDTNGIITTVAGTGEKGSSGDGGLATDAQLRRPVGLAIDRQGDLFIADAGDHRIRRVDSLGVITTWAGTGAAGFSGDGGLATQANLSSPAAVAVNAQGSVLIADTGNHRIRKVTQDGRIQTIAGSGVPGFSGDDGPAIEAQVNSPDSLAMGRDGTLYFSDGGNHRIRRVNPDETISAVAGSGDPGKTRKGNASSADLESPFRVALDPWGRLFIGDGAHHHVHLVDETCALHPVAGTGTAGFSGDGGPALGAQLHTPLGLTVDPVGDIFVPDSGSHHVRKLWSRLGDNCGEVAAVVIDPAVVVGGQSSTGYVRLTCPVEVDTTVTLISDNSLVTVPPFVVIPTGQTTGAFAIVTGPPHTRVLVTITGTTGNTPGTGILTLLPPSEAQTLVLTLYSNSLMGGESTTGLVRLGIPAPAGGAHVQLASENAAVRVAASVHVSEGQVTSEFLVVTNPVTKSGPAVIVGALGEAVDSVSLMLWPLGTDPGDLPKIGSLTLDPNVVTGGETSHGTVTLTEPAPPGGALILLASNRAAANPPAQVTIPEGETSAGFEVATSTVHSLQTAKITATAGNSVSANLRIQAEGGDGPGEGTIQSLNVSPSSVKGGASSTGTVTLSAPAAAGGVLVDLSSNSGSAGVPSSITIPQGSTQGTFNVTTSAVQAEIVATLTATSANSATATLTIQPDNGSPGQGTIQSLVVSPGSVKGGVSATGTATLSAPAAAGGVLVNLSSNSGSAGVPSSITIPQGSTQGTFNVTTSAVQAEIVATLTATSANSATATLTIQPDNGGPGQGTIQSLTVAPGSVYGGSSAAGTVTLSAPAGAGGIVVNLSSSVGSATVVASITVPEGSTQGTFQVTTTAVGLTTVATITATSANPASDTLTIMAPCVDTLTLSVSSILGGGSVLGTVTLTSPAPAGGAKVTLLSSDAAVNLPSTVTVPPGQISATFQATTVGVITLLTATIEALFGDCPGITVELDVESPILQSLGLSSSTVPLLGSVVGTVHLNGPAPAGGIVVDLDSTFSIPLLNVLNLLMPTSATVLEGETSANFQITALGVLLQNLTGTISASFDGIVKTTGLTITLLP